jgi:hypothetical protein
MKQGRKGGCPAKARHLKKTLAAATFALASFGLFASGASEGDMDESISLTGIDALVVDGSFFTVDITGHAEQSLEAQFTMSARLRDRGVKVVHESRGSELRVRVSRPALTFGVLPGEIATLSFRVPAMAVVKVNNSSGRVAVSNLQSGELDLEASSGSLELRGVAAEIVAATSSGKIMVESCDGGKNLRASSGAVIVRDAGGDIRAKTSSGAHTYEGISGSISAESSSGRINVSNSEGSIDLSASSGKLTATTVNITGDSSFKTSSGAIDIDFTNSIDDFSFELESSSGLISAGGTRAKGRVSSGSGAIRIRGKSSSGSQTYR